MPFNLIVPLTASIIFYRKVLLSLCVIILCTTQSTQASAKRASIKIYLPVSQQQLEPAEVARLHAVFEATKPRMEIVFADYWLGFIASIRQGQVGVYFAPPHFTAWLVHQHGFLALTHLEQDLRYAVVAANDHLPVYETSDLAGKILCVRHSSDLDTSIIVGLFSKSARWPKVNAHEDLDKIMLSNPSQCDAFIITEAVFHSIHKTHPQNLVQLHVSKPFSNYAFSISTSIQESERALVQQFLIEEDTRQALMPIYMKFSISGLTTNAQRDRYPHNLISQYLPHW